MQQQTPSLHAAALCGDVKALQNGFDANPQVLNEPDGSGCSALHIAAWYGHSEAVAALVAMGAGVATTDEKGRTPLHAAACNGSVEALEILMRQVDTTAKAQQDKEGHTILHTAAKTNQLAIIQSLKTKKGLIDVRDARGLTAVHTAALFSSHAVLQELLSWPLPKGVFDTTEGLHLLRVSMQVFDFEAIELTRTALKISLEKLSSILGWGEAHIAVYDEKEVTVDMHIIETDANGSTALHLAAGLGKETALKQMLGLCRKAKLKRLQKEFSELVQVMTAHNDTLHLAECPDQTQRLITELTWDYSDCINVRDSDGRTPLHIACQYAQTGVVSLLLSLSADPNPVDSFKWSPLHHATDRGDAETVGLLLSHEAAPNLAADQGMCPITLAAGKGHTEVLSLLLSSRGAEVSTAALVNTIRHSQIGALKILCSKMPVEGVTTPCTESEAGPLGFAIASGDLMSVEVLLALNPQLNTNLLLETIRSITLPEMKKKQVLHFLLRRLKPTSDTMLAAAVLGEVECMGILADCDASLLNQAGNVGDVTSVTPLQAVLLPQREVAALLLLELGADPNAAGQGLPPPLITAIESRMDSVVRLILEKGGSPNEVIAVPSGKRIPINALTSAVMVGSEHFCRWLYKKGADLECRRGGTPPLLVACKEKKWDIAQLLVSLGSSVNVFSMDSEEGDVGPLWYAFSGVREKLCYDFLSRLMEEMCPPPLVQEAGGARMHLQEVKTSTFTVMQAAATRAALQGIRCMLSGSKQARIHAGFCFDGLQAIGTTEVQRVLTRWVSQVDVLIFVQSSQQASAVMSEIMWRKPPPSRSLSKSGSSTHGGYGSEDMPVPRPPKRRALIIFRCKVDLTQFNCLY